MRAVDDFQSMEPTHATSFQNPVPEYFLRIFNRWYGKRMRDESTGPTQSTDGVGIAAGGARHEPSILLRLPLFDGVGDELVRNLIRNSSTHLFRAGAIIVRQGQAFDALHVVIRGIVDLIHVDGDRECGVLLLSAKDLLMPSVTLFNEPALVTARALTTSKIMLFERPAIELAVEQSAAFSSNLMKAMSGQWRMAVRNILDLSCRSAAQRLGAFLMRLADLQPGGESAVLPIPKRHLAVRLGMTAETLSRMLQVVATHGLYLRGRTIIVRDRQAIEEFCGPDPYPQNDERSLDVFAL